MNSLFSNNSASTQKARINYLRKIGIKNVHEYDMLKDVDNIMKKFVLDSTNVNTQVVRIFHIIEFLKAVKDESLLEPYVNIMKKLKEASIIKQNDTSTNVRSDRYEIPLNELQTILLSKNPYPNFDLGMGKSINMIKAYQDYILLSLYVLNPPLRNDFHNLKIITKAADIKDSGNYLVINPRTIYIYLNEYKNSKKMGSIRVDLTEYTKTLIRNLFKLYKSLKKTPASLFNHISVAKIEPMSEEAMKKRIKFVSNQYFLKELSINDYRHIWEIAIQNDDEYKNLNLNDREALHKKLLHSMNTALKYNRV